jgi:replication-associated recombination protein RarA
MIKLASQSTGGNGFTLNLARKYRPRTLADIRGQAAAVRILKRFAQSAVDDATPAAFLFHGPSGVGKSATAWALADALGCDPDDPDMSGISEIPSGQQDGAAVRQLLDSLRLRPLLGSGWKVAIINEADNMTTQAEAIWLDGLEKLPRKTVVIFTTNNTGRLSGRLATRCHEIEFEGCPKKLRRSIVDLARDVWHEETGNRLGGVPANLGVMSSLFPTASYRLALQQLASYLAVGKIPAAASACEVKESAASDGSSAARKAWETRRRKAVAR